jgi:TonB-linked SusC/RagA family outer membrane protein
MKRIALALAIVGLGLAVRPATSSAQTGVVTGRVLTDAGTPVEGVTIQVAGTNRRAVTDADGRYTIDGLPPGAHRLLARRIGFRRVEQAASVVAAQSVTLDFRLAESAVELEEVVVSVEAGEVERKEIGTDIAHINVEAELQGAVVETFSDLLNARAANVTITPSSGLLGSGSRVRIRGTNSLIQDNNPLIVIDGVRVTNSTDLGPIGTGGQTSSRFDDLDPDEIEDIQIIKGPSATALYGSEAAPGVIVITTKRGRAGEGRAGELSLTIRQGFAENPAEFPDTYENLTADFGVTDPNDPRLAQFRIEQHPLTGDVFVVDNPLEDADSRPFSRGWFSTYDLSYRGASESASYYASVGYDDRDGLVPDNSLYRVNGRANAHFLLGSKVDLAVSTGVIVSNRRFPDDNSTASGYGVNGMLGTPANSFGTDPQGGPGRGECLREVLTGMPTTICDQRNGNFSATFEKLATREQGEDVTRLTGSVTLTVRPTTWLTSAVTLGLDHTDSRVFDLTPFDPDLPFGNASLGSITDHRAAARFVSADYRATAALNLTDRLSSSSTFGLQYFGRFEESTTCTGEQFPSDAVRTCDAAQINRGAASLLENVEVGGFFQQRFGLNDYVFVTGAVRIDDNSSLGDRADAIWSPSANISAVVSDMPFWAIRQVNDLRLRFAWGKASQSPGQYQADRTFQTAPVLINGVLVTGITPQNPGNPELGPERSEEFEAGLDLGVLDGRLAVTFSYYDVTTRDLIVPAPVPPSSGFPGLQFVNLGSMNSDGWELALDAQVIENSWFGWQLRYQHSTNHAVITDLGLPSPIFFPQGADGGSRAAGSQVFQTGVAPGAYVSEVIANATRAADGTITDFEFAPGNLGDGTDRRVVGQPFPTNEQSVQSVFTFWNNLRLSALFDRAGGHQLLDVTQAFRTPFSSSSFSREYAYREVESTPEEQAMFENRILAAFIQDADFIKLREISLSYTLPQRLVSKLGATRATLTVGGRNLATWTDFTGLDPEMSVRGSRDEFTQNNFGGSFPPARSFSMALGLTF